MRAILTDFLPILPAYRYPQDQLLAWVGEAHGLAGKDERLGRLAKRLGCSPEKVGFRMSDLPDFGHRHWEEMGVYPLRRDPAGAGLERRMEVYTDVVEGVCARAFPEGAPPPADLIHVSCTGYVSPSAAQRLVQKRGWSRETRVTHAYHMGCYAAVPALRMATGFLAAEGGAVDVLHTELCSLHFDPTDGSPDRMVIHGLFADGHIKYRIDAEATHGLRVLALHEELVPGTDGQMGWALGAHGFRMALAREVPAAIAAEIAGFVQRLLAKAGQSVGATVYAIHPGGPRIVDEVQRALGLKDGQVEWSRRVLYERGNMSSATLPHIWERMLADPGLEPGTRVVSLAFGPGLTLCGAVFTKQ